MSRFCKFRDQRDGSEVFVNPVNVLYVRPDASGLATIIQFGHDELIVVAEAVAKVASALETAQRQ